MTQDLAELDQLWRRLDVALVTPPAVGSEAERALQDRLRAYAHDQAATALRAALDHLRAWRALLRAGEVPTYAHISLLRTSHEAGLLAYWLVEPSIDSDTHLARGVAAQAADYDERRKFEQASNMPAPPTGKLAVDRLADLMDAAQAAGLARLDRTGKRILTVNVPATVELFDLYERARPGTKAQYLYRLYSGYAHAKQWAVMLWAQQQAPHDDRGRTIAKTEASDLLAVFATRRAMTAAGRAVTALEQYRSVDSGS